MMNAHVANLLNEQINKEFYSAYLYLDFANYFERTGLAGFANFLTLYDEPVLLLVGSPLTSSIVST